MRRAHGHLLFGLVAATCAAVALGELARFEHARRINSEVAEWSVEAREPGKSAVPAAPAALAATTLPVATIPPTAAAPSTKWTAGASDKLTPEGRLAHAVALSSHDYDAALAAFKAVIQSNREDLRRIALYDLGNLHLHEAIKVGVADQSQSLPLTELAKQSYRDLLRRDPYDWDARYNLERTLRLAPEDEGDSEDDTEPADPHQHERTTIADPRMDLP